MFDPTHRLPGRDAQQHALRSQSFQDLVRPLEKRLVVVRPRTEADETFAICLIDLGADLAINYRTEDFVEAVKAGTPQGGADRS